MLNTRAAFAPMRPALASLLVVLLFLPGVARAELDPRGDWNLSWTAPGPTGEVAAYDIRISSSAPGADLEAWWAAAESQISPPAPLPAGTPQAWLRRQLQPGRTVHAAVRAANAAGDWSPISNVVSWTPSDLPLIQQVSPTESPGGPEVFTLRGVGVATATAVRIHRPGGGVIEATGVGALLDGSVTFAAALPSGVTEVLDVEVVTPTGNDLLRGWIEIGGGVDPAPATVTDFAATALSPTSVRLSWHAPGDVDLSGDEGPAAAYDIRRLVEEGDTWSWDSGIAIAAPAPAPPGQIQFFVVQGLPEGSLQAFALRSRDDAGHWSEISPVSVVQLPEVETPPPDFAAPDRITDLAGSAEDSTTVVLTWTTPADNSPWGDVAVDRYDLRRLGGEPGAWQWSSGSPVTPPEPLTPGEPATVTVQGLPTGSRVAFGVAAVDSAGNVAPYSNFVEVELAAWTPPDPWPPEAVTDLAIEALDPETIRLTWSAPTDQGPAGPRRVASYDLRRLSGSPGNWSWEEGSGLPSPTPGAPGSEESFTVSGLPAGEAVAFAVASIDSAGLSSAVSAFAEILLPSPPDTVGPAAVSDLAAELDDEGMVTLTWTSPADAAGEVVSLEFRRAPAAPEEFDWDQASALPDPPAPGNPGATRSWGAALGVAAGEVFTVALRSRDGDGNLSALSNLVTVDRRGEDVTAPAEPSELQAVRSGQNAVQLRWRAPGDDGMAGRATRYELCVVLQPDLDTEWWRTVEPEVLPGAPKPAGKREVCNRGGLLGGEVYGFALRAVDEAEWASEWTWVLLEVDGGVNVDAAPPLPVEGTRAVSGPLGVEVTWSPAPEPDLVSYRVHRKLPGQDRELVGEVGASTHAFLDTGLPPAGTAYAVTAVDSQGDEPDYWQWVGVDAAPGSPNLTLSRVGGDWVLTLFPESPEAAPDRGVEPPRVLVFDVLGRRVAEVEAIADAAGWTARWDGRESTGRPVPSGVFFMRVQDTARTVTRKVLIAR